MSVAEDYPGLHVWDRRVSGSITAGDSRLPLWAFAYSAIVEGWTEVENGYEPSRYGLDAEGFGAFVTYLLDHRKSFARLLCVLADVHRRETEASEDNIVWWDKDMPEQRERVREALLACLAELDDAS